MSVAYRTMLEKVRDLKLKKDDMSPLSYEDENDLVADPIIIERQHLILVLKRFQQERITEEDLFDWIHFVWFSDYFTCAEDDADAITGVIQVLEELEEEGDLQPEEIAHCLYALEHNVEVHGVFE